MPSLAQAHGYTAIITATGTTAATTGTTAIIGTTTTIIATGRLSPGRRLMNAKRGGLRAACGLRPAGGALGSPAASQSLGLGYQRLAARVDRHYLEPQFSKR